MNWRWILAVAAALVAGIVLGAAFSGREGGPSAPKAGAAGARVWTCSMHPQVQQPSSGTCPICAMDLIPRSQLGEGGQERMLSMSEEAVKLAQIGTSPVVRRHPVANVQLFGKVVYDETRVRSLSARFPGRIDRLFVDYTGIRVRAGDHLATIYSPELLTAQSELLTAKRFGNREALAAARDKLRLWGFSAEQIRQVEASGEPSDQLDINAPIPGVVTHKNVNEGDYIETGMPLFKIAELDRVWVMLDGYESDLVWLRFGQPVTFTAEALGARVFEGRIAFLSPELDPETRTVRGRVNVENEDEALKPGMFVRANVKARVAGSGRVIEPELAGKWISPMHPEIIKDEPGTCDICGMDLVPAEELGYNTVDPEAPPPLVIPASAVLYTGKRSVVYVEVPDRERPHFEGREVLLGPRAGEEYIVEAGLREGERVVTEGAFKIDSSLQIQAQPSMMLPEEEPSPLFRRFTVGEEFRQETARLLEAYFDVRKALADDNFPSSREAAASFRETLDGVTSDNLNAAALEAWRELSRRMRMAAAKVREAPGIEPAREAFEPLSLALEEVVRRFGTTPGLPVYRVHCPMAFEDRGADWLQAEKEIRNPYFGDRMLRCGFIEETLTEGEEPEPDAESEADDGGEQQ